MVNEATIRRVMKRLATECVDRLTGDVNHVLLAQLACSDCGGYVDHEIPEIFFKIAREFH